MSKSIQNKQTSALQKAPQQKSPGLAKTIANKVASALVGNQDAPMPDSLLQISENPRAVGATLGALEKVAQALETGKLDSLSLKKGDAQSNLGELKGDSSFRQEAQRAVANNDAATIKEIVKQGQKTLLEGVGETCPTVTQRLAEMPHLLPPDHGSFGPGRPLDLNTLDPSKNYLWTLTPKGEFVIAPEVQEGFGITEHQPNGRKVKHGDLNPGPDGMSRAPGRAGGDLRAEKNEEAGGIHWVLDMNSSYSFNRTDRKILQTENAQAMIGYLDSIGSDVTNLKAGSNVYDPILHLAGKVHWTLDKFGLGKLMN